MINSINDLIPKYFLNINEINWRDITVQYQFSDDFIDEFQNKLDWEKLSMRHKMTDDFINKFQHKIIWSKIIFNPNFNYECILKYINKFEIKDLENYIKFNMQRLDKLKELKLIREMIN